MLLVMISATLSLAAFAVETVDNGNAAKRFAGIYDQIQKAGDHNKIAQEIAAFRQEFPKNLYPLLALAELKYLEGRLASRADVLNEALALAQQALQLDASVPDVYIILAKIAVEQRNLARATELADKALSLAPNKPEALFAKGRAEQANGNYEEAANWFRKSADAFSDPIRKSNATTWIYYALNDNSRIPAERQTT